MNVSVLTASLVLGLVHLETVSGHKHKLRYGQYDPLIVARCEAQCWNFENRNPVRFN